MCVFFPSSLHTTISLEHKNWYRYDYKFHTVTNGVCKLYLKLKAKTTRFAQNVYFRQSLHVTVQLPLFGTAFIQSCFQMKVETDILFTSSEDVIIKCFLRWCVCYHFPNLVSQCWYKAILVILTCNLLRIAQLGVSRLFTFVWPWR